MTLKKKTKISLAEAFPLLIKEWHPTKNENLSPYDVSFGSAKKVWWKCPNGEDHEWLSSINNRTKPAKQGCPICKGQKVVNSNCLKTLRPDLAEEWHPSKNGILTPMNVSCGSPKKVWWVCKTDKNHEWQATIGNRSSQNQGCPLCKNKQVSATNNLAFKNPEIAKQWHPTRNGTLTPYDVVEGSNKKVWWKCPIGEDHEWKTAISHRINGRNCPICSGRKVVLSNSLSILNPELAKEWHTIKNKDLKIEKTALNSHKKVWWKCTKKPDHIWKASVASRAFGRGCPFCADYGFNNEKPGILYYIKIKHLDQLYFKIGITNNTVESRYKRYDKIKFLDYIEIKFEKGQDANNIEKSILREFKKNIVSNIVVLKDGNTEIFDQDVLNFEEFKHNGISHISKYININH